LTYRDFISWSILISLCRLFHIAILES
jgi:hypothetical protein